MALVQQASDVLSHVHGTLLRWHDGFLAAITMLVQAAAAWSWLQAEPERTVAVARRA
jgi:hypothetical protein